MLNTLEYFWPDISAKRAERLLLETSLEWLYPVNRDNSAQNPPICEASVNETSDDGDSCLVCGLLN